jgi:cyclopropane-fatty-acyl-phospholipid synthase
MDPAAIKSPPRPSDPSVKRAIALLKDALEGLHPRDFAIRLWDGSTLDPESGYAARFTLVLKHPGALRRMFLPANELTLGEAYIYDDFDIEGEMEPAFALAAYLTGKKRSLFGSAVSALRLLSFPASRRPRLGRQGAQLRGEQHSVERDRQAVTYHYDVSNDFFSLWLGRRMVYSCAYFQSPGEDLDTAQERKLEYVCRKLRLQKGERLLDIGCGWGGLVLYAAEKHGVEAVGVTLSQPQAELAATRIQNQGLGDRCRVLVKDYRRIEEWGTFDKLVSIGMFEHVGESRLSEYFERAWKLLRPGGVFLNHGIGQMVTGPARRVPSFSDRYVFPDGELLPISTTLRVAEEQGFEVRDVESLREHYMLTLRQWVQRLEAQHEEARRVTDETTYRIWRLFMSGSAYQFRSNEINVYQSLLVKAREGKSGLPLTREDWYR